MNRSHTLAILGVMGLATLAALLWPRAHAPSPTTRSHGAEASGDAPEIAAPVRDERTDLDRRIEAMRALAERDGTWLDWENVAALYVDRADLGGGLEDLGLADEALDRAFAVARPGVGPHAHRASLDFRLHRLDDCETMIEAIEGYGVMLANDREVVTSLRSDLAFFRGEYAEARERYTQRNAGGADPVVLFALARLEWSTGHGERAAQLLDQADAAAASEPGLHGFLALARATFERDRGRLEEAARHASRAMSLRATHLDTVLLLAEVRLEQGELDAADALVTRALAIDDAPQAHELAARIARTRGDAIAMEEHRSAATRAIEALYPRFPEAIAGHALLHFLRFEDEARAIEMAEVNARARPFGEARARLALAYLRAARTEDAQREIEAVLATEWSTGESHAIAAEIFSAQSDARAQSERDLAEQLAPGAADRVADLRRH
ncbi:MAG: tetratricopeptide repeat protein [Deltaproteobacteria bacterium]|nr:tetratricopeptide repeat protein [Deltaproteobacteria bacterium]